MGPIAILIFRYLFVSLKQSYLLSRPESSEVVLFLQKGIK